MSDSWYSVGAQEADKLAASTQTRRTRNFFTKAGEIATIRFLKPANESFNYRRSFVSWAKGQKLLTSPGTQPDPFVERGLSLQAAYAWPIIDRRIFEFEDNDTGEQRKSGPRILFFADGTRTRKQLQNFEKQMLQDYNEEREENGEEPVTLAEYNLTSYDIRCSKEQKAPWNFTAKRPKSLSKEDKDLVEKAEIDLSTHEWLAKELAPLPVAELRALLGGQKPEVDESDSAGEAYSYSDDEEDTVKFED